MSDAAALGARLLTVPEVTVALKMVNDAAVRTMIRRGRLPAVLIGKRLMVARSAVEAIIVALEARPVAFPSAPLLRGAHTLLSCFGVRGHRWPPSAVDGICDDPACPMASEGNT